MEKKMLFIFNPKAGKEQIRSKLVDILDVYTKAGYEVIARPTQGAKDAYEQVKAYAGQVDVIACSGGDGTLDEVVTGLMECEERIPINYIPSGSTNDFANSLYMPKDMIKCASLITEGKLYGCDIGRFNDGTFVYIAAFGLFTDVAYETDQNLKNILGHVAYVLEGVKRLFDIKFYPMMVEVDGQVFEEEFIYGMVTNSRSVGGFKNLTGKNIDMNDGLFEVTLIRKPKNPLELQEIIGSLLIAEDRTDLIHSLKAKEIHIEAREPVPWTLDGEFGGTHTDLTIRNMYQALEIYLEK